MHLNCNDYFEKIYNHVPSLYFFLHTRGNKNSHVILNGISNNLMDVLLQIMLKYFFC